MCSHDEDYTYSVSGRVRWAALAYAVFVIYPQIISSYVRTKLFCGETLTYLLLSPWLVPRNLLGCFISIYPHPATIPYHLSLKSKRISFGPPGGEMANSYSAVQRIFSVRGQQILLLRDGWLVFLPSISEHGSVAERIQQRADSARRNSKSAALAESAQ